MLLYLNVERAETRLIDCSKLSGSDTNYQYQCEGRSDAKVVIAAAELVSGKLVCAKKE